MQAWINLVILAVVQGITEFLPVSSSGHLEVLSAFFGFRGEESVTIEIMLHTGSLVAIVIFYFRLLLGFFTKSQFHLLLMVLLGSIPAGIAGVAIKGAGMDAAVSGYLPLVGMGFLITGVLLNLPDKKKLVERATGGKAPTELADISWKQALVIGLAQMVAIRPGISRSGSTISVGLLAGLKRDAAAAFSFLLALPAIAGATLLEVVKLVRKGNGGYSFSYCQLAVAAIVSAVVSYFALRFLVRLVNQGRLGIFRYYLFALGAAVLIYSLWIIDK